MAPVHELILRLTSEIDGPAASDMSANNLRRVGEELEAAIARTRPGNGIVIEVGTRLGGSAQLMLEVLRHHYTNPPMLWTIDPYGEKPYKPGSGPEGRIYHNAHFVVAKKRLAAYPNHAHFYMTSTEAFYHLGHEDCGTWYEGKQIGDKVMFALLDGDHDAETIKLEVRLLRDYMIPGGAIVIDNADADPETIPAMEAMYGRTSGPYFSRQDGYPSLPGEAQIILVKR